MDHEIVEKALKNVTKQAVDGLADIYGDDGIRLILCMKQTIWSFLERGDEDMTFAIRFVDELIENFNN